MAAKTIVVVCRKCESELAKIRKEKITLREGVKSGVTKIGSQYSMELGCPFCMTITEARL
jgi:hypothetical protein